MAESIRPDGSNPSTRTRRKELIRPVVQRRVFSTREAQRVLQQKERRWAPIAYGIVLAALLVIFGTTYTTYAFSKYRGVILPGVRVDNTSLAGMTPTQADIKITNRLAAIYGVPIILTHGTQRWSPSKRDIGLAYRVQATVNEAMRVGRTGSFVPDLFDRLPVHTDHAVPLLYRIKERVLKRYILKNIASNKVVHQPPANANLTISRGHVVLERSRPGIRLNFRGTEQVIHSALGSLSKQTKPLPVTTIPPVITDAYARGIQQRVEAFLSRPPVIGIGKHVIPVGRTTLASMLYFPPNPVVSHGRADITLHVNPVAVSTFVGSLASQIDTQPHNAVLTFDGRRVSVVSPKRFGHALDQSVAVTKLLNVLRALRPGARLHFKLTRTTPPLDLGNPASLGINTLLGTGATSFQGAGQTRLDDVVNISQRLKDVLLPPNQAISFNQLVGPGWPSRVYLDAEAQSQGQLIPGPGGAMQQVATTFLRALYGAGLQLLERHSHVYRLPWYEPPGGVGPIGLDAIVDPPSDDLRFLNDTGKYLLIEPRVEPIRQELYIYVYGPKLGWQVSFDKLGTILKTYPHGPAIVRTNPSLLPGQRVQTAWAHDGADTVVERTITRPNGDVSVQRLYTHYRPWQAVIELGPSGSPTSTPTPTGTATPSRRHGTPTATPGATPTPTFNH